MSRKYWSWAGIFACSTLLGGCATVTPLSGHFPQIMPNAAQSGAMVGKEVRWGGQIIKTQPKAHQTCFTMLGEPLHANGRPQSERGEAHVGRFYSCAPGFYDPMLYRPGRDVTFIGRIGAVVHHKVGEFTYAYPDSQHGLLMAGSSDAFSGA